MTTFAISTLTALVTFVLTAAGTYVTTRRELQLKFDESLRDLRIGAYKDLWKSLEALAKYARPEPLTGRQVRELAATLRTWYFETGGIFLSVTTRGDYFALLDALQLLAADDEAPITRADDEYLRVLGSRLRTGMTRDVGTRRTYIFHRIDDAPPLPRRAVYEERGGRRRLAVGFRRSFSLRGLVGPGPFVTWKPVDVAVDGEHLRPVDWDSSRLTVHGATAVRGGIDERSFLLEPEEHQLVEGPRGWNRWDGDDRPGAVIWDEAREPEAVRSA